MSFEIACTIVLLIVTGLVVRSFSRVVNERHDFDANRVTVAEVDLLNSRYEQGQDGGPSHTLNLSIARWTACARIPALSLLQ